MKEVAELAGVSTATVSRYINKSGYVSSKSKKNIQKAIDQLNYSPNEVARSLFQKKSKFIGLLLPDVTNPFFTMLSKGVEDKLNESEYGLILANVQNSQEKEEEYLNSFRNNNIAGIISAIEHKTNIYKDLPNVSIDRPSSFQKYSVYSDDYEGGVLAAKEIIKRSPNEILILHSTEHLAKSKKRLKGMQSVLDDHSFKYHVYNISSFRLNEVNGMINIINEKYPNVDSIIASNDLHALVLLKEAIEKGINVPEDLQIIGYDDIIFSDLATPGLSTIHQPIYEMGNIGAELLLNIINDKEIKNNKITLPVEFIERGSLRKKIE